MCIRGGESVVNTETKYNAGNERQKYFWWVSKYMLENIYVSFFAGGREETKNDPYDTPCIMMMKRDNNNTWHEISRMSKTREERERANKVNVLSNSRCQSYLVEDLTLCPLFEKMIFFLFCVFPWMSLWSSLTFLLLFFKLTGFNHCKWSDRRVIEYQRKANYQMWTLAVMHLTCITHIVSRKCKEMESLPRSAKTSLPHHLLITQMSVCLFFIHSLSS